MVDEQVSDRPASLVGGLQPSLLFDIRCRPTLKEGFPVEELRTYLLPPPLLVERGELPPVIEPGLVGVPPYERPLPDQIEPFASEPLEPAVSAELESSVQAVVIANASVRKHVDGRRHEWIGVSVVDSKAAADCGWGKGPSLLAVMYSYDDDRAIEVRLDAAGKKVHAVEQLAYQPPPTAAEIERAIELARADERHAAKIKDDLVGTAILVSTPDSLSPTFNRRQFDVRFTSPCHRLPDHSAIVDLSRETVVSVGPCCSESHCGEREVGS